MKKNWVVSISTVMGLMTMPPLVMAASTNSTSHQVSAPNVYAYPYPGHLIKYGTTGNYVKEMQQRLNQLPKSNAGQVDGIFGPKTIIAVELFQMSHGLTVDGIVGPQTWHKLFNR